ncbi:hypothetical protein Rhe02_39050 [Rhizocola hellebori]|uniref:Uncharacterized protein n=1 Tax=Rhizocola hellebori TaxID=1392758 RepID=A0A8J3Q808_9ACTN|nr:hypothetical protein Rhe02_39050 [Rhizocola hellebori]
MPGAIDAFLVGISEWLSGSSVAVAGGSLFQLVIAYVSVKGPRGALNRFCVVPSEELSSIHGVQELPKAFGFDAFGTGS